MGVWRLKRCLDSQTGSSSLKKQLYGLCKEHYVNAFLSPKGGKGRNRRAPRSPTFIYRDLLFFQMVQQYTLYPWKGKLSLVQTTG